MFSAGTPSCTGMPITFTNMSNASGGSITTWNWTFGDGTDTTFNAAVPNFTHTYSQAGTFIVTLHVLTAQGCESATQQTITTSPSPIAAFGYTNTCQGQSTQFTDMTSLNGGSILTQRLWNFGDPASGILNTSSSTNPVHNYSQPGQYSVSLITLNSGGCVDTVFQNVSITPKPDVDFYNDSLVCLGSTISLFTDTIVTNTGAILSYNWDFGDGSPHAFTPNVSHTYAVADTYTVTLTVQDTSGCQNIKSRPLTIHQSPVTAFTWSGVCQNAGTQFTDLSTAPAGDVIVSWKWDFGISSSTTDTSTLKNPVFTYTQPGTYTVSLITTTGNGCSNSRSMPIQVWNAPTATFNYTASPCANGLVQFQDSSWSYQGTVNSWQWEFEPFQYGTGTNPKYQYYAVDSCYTVKLVIKDLRGCVDTTLQQVCVPPPLTIDFNINQSCFGTAVSFTPLMLTPTSAADSLISFNWNFGDPATGANNISTKKKPDHIFSKTGYYTVNFTSTDKFGCTATMYKTLQVKALPVANFSYTAGDCDSTLVFTSTSSDTTSHITSYIWQYGDGTSDTLNTFVSTHKYGLPGEYNASLTVTNANGCSASFTGKVTRSACLVAAYLTTNDLFCQNKELAFADKSTSNGTITQWQWNFGDGSPALAYGTFKPVVTHLYSDPGNYTISLKVSTLVGSSTVSDSTKLDIAVLSSPSAGFVVNPVCLGAKTEFADTSQANGSTSLSYLWEFGDAGTADTSVLSNPKYIYTLPGSYIAQQFVKSQNGCSDTASAAVTVNGLPDAGFANSLSCSGQKTYFFDASEAYLANLNSWGWRVNDSLGFAGAMQGNMPSFVFASAGTYPVRLTVADINGCSDTIEQYVEVNAAPVSAFSYIENFENTQGQIQFTNGSVGAKEYFWDFGNGETSMAESPIITYAYDGIYTVSLITISSNGCQDTTTMAYDMLFKGLYVPNAIAPGGTIQATRYWKPVGMNLASYRAEIYNSLGQLIWSSRLLDEKGAPKESWDGTFNEKPCQQDVYVWKIMAIFRDGSVWDNQDVGERKGLSDPVYGTITLIR